jgi:hypothetical protein
MWPAPAAPVYMGMGEPLHNCDNVVRSWTTVQSQAAWRIFYPEDIDQHDSNACGPAAIMNITADTNPGASRSSSPPTTRYADTSSTWTWPPPGSWLASREAQGAVGQAARRDAAAVAFHEGQHDVAEVGLDEVDVGELGRAQLGEPVDAARSRACARARCRGRARCAGSCATPRQRSRPRRPGGTSATSSRDRQRDNRHDHGAAAAMRPHERPAAPRRD